MMYRKSSLQQIFNIFNIYWYLIVALIFITFTFPQLHTINFTSASGAMAPVVIIGVNSLIQPKFLRFNLTG